jgi:hypothetical protein
MLPFLCSVVEPAPSLPAPRIHTRTGAAIWGHLLYAHRPAPQTPLVSLEPNDLAGVFPRHPRGGRGTLGAPGPLPGWRPRSVNGWAAGNQYFKPPWPAARGEPRDPGGGSPPWRAPAPVPRQRLGGPAAGVAFPADSVLAWLAALASCAHSPEKKFNVA